MKIKTLMLSMLMAVAGTMFTACGSDDDDNKQPVVNPTEGTTVNPYSLLSRFS